MTDLPRNVAIKSLKTAKFLKRITFSRTPPRAILLVFIDWGLGWGAGDGGKNKIGLTEGRRYVVSV